MLTQSKCLQSYNVSGFQLKVATMLPVLRVYKAKVCTESLIPCLAMFPSWSHGLPKTLGRDKGQNTKLGKKNSSRNYSSFFSSLKLLQMQPSPSDIGTAALLRNSKETTS